MLTSWGLAGEAKPFPGRYEHVGRPRVSPGLKQGEPIGGGRSLQAHVEASVSTKAPGLYAESYDKTLRAARGGCDSAAREELRPAG